jgi:hypothetical protein
MGQPPIYGQTQQATGVNPAAGTAVDAPPPVNETPDLEQRVAAMVEARLSAVEEKYQDRIKELEESLSRTAPTSNLPEHSAGPGLDIAPTWGQYHQERAAAGTLTDDDKRAVGIKVDG